MARDINKTEFDEATSLKLDIFRECFKEWLPVFIHSPYTKKTFIYDFFSGSGKDKLGNSGSPLILMEEAMGEGQKYCSKANKGDVIFAFNEKIKTKQKELQSNFKVHIEECLKNCGREECVYEHHFGNYEFKEAFERENVQKILNEKAYSKFILLDQYGFKEVNNDIFQKLVKSPKTDFIFFISSSFIRRFREHPYIQKYFETHKINFDEEKPKECHRTVANYFKSLIPNGTEYFLHNFSIKKGSNYYGLIFGTSHSFGMEKFLKVCWDKDKLAGESNFLINNDHPEGTLFYDEEKSIKKEKFKKTLEQKILSAEIRSNLSGLHFTLKSGVITKVYLETVENLRKRNEIRILGDFNKRITNIHRLTDKDIYHFEIIK